MRIGLAIPLAKTTESKFIISLIDQLNENFMKYDLDILTHIDCYVDRSRNELVKKAKLGKCDYVWFVDTDHIFPKGTLTRLLKVMEEKNAQIVSGLYFTRTSPIIPVIRKMEDDTYEPIYDYKGIIEVDGIGMGCCLINMKLFDNISFPYFEGIYEHKFGFDGFVGEDLYFCRKVREQNIPIYVDTDLVIKHIGGIVDDDDFNPYREQYKQAEKIKQELIDDLAEFTNKSRAEIKLSIVNGSMKFKEEWDLANPQTKQQRETVYRTSQWYKFDLANWHLGARLRFDLQLVNMIKTKYPDKQIAILDYGCGSGYNSFLLAKEGYTNITLFDLNTAFAEFRFDKHGLSYTTRLQDKYDLVFCFDVLEHLDDDDFNKTIELFKSLRKEDTEFLITAPFGDQGGIHPMHFNSTQDKIKQIKELMSNAETG